VDHSPDTTPLAQQRQAVDSLSKEILAVLPQKAPFRFLDRIIEISEEHIVGQYTFRHDEYFYAGHFPGQPLTPGVILIETMAQTAVVAFGIYTVLLERQRNPEADPTEYFLAFSEVEVQFLAPVLPGQTVTVHGKQIYLRHKKLRAKAELYLDDGRLAASAVLSGVGVKSK
jgi:3-hydroxyacyl-[acyl-carrier-protein] dehydratase